MSFSLKSEQDCIPTWHQKKWLGAKWTQKYWIIKSNLCPISPTCFAGFFCQGRGLRLGLHMWCLLRPCWSLWLLTKWCGEFWEDRADLSVKRDRSSSSSSILKWAYPSESNNEGAGGLLGVRIICYSKTCCKKQHTLASTTPLRILLPFTSLFFIFSCFFGKSISSSCILAETFLAGWKWMFVAVMWYSSL